MRFWVQCNSSVTFWLLYQNNVTCTRAQSLILTLGSPFVEARQAGLVGAVVAVCLLLLALAKLGYAALETLSDELETLSEMSSTSTDKFLDWKYCVTLGNFSLNFSSSLFLFLFSRPLRNHFMLNFATTRQIFRDRNITWPGIICSMMDLRYILGWYII